MMADLRAARALSIVVRSAGKKSGQHGPGHEEDGDQRHGRGG